MGNVELQQLYTEIARRIEDRARRVALGILKGGAVIAGVMFLIALLNISRYSEAWEGNMLQHVLGELFWPVMNLLFFAAMSLLYVSRNRLVAARGNLLFGRLLSPARLFGSDVIQNDHGPTFYMTVGQALSIGVRSFERVLPTQMSDFELVVRGKPHLFSTYLYGDEKPVIVDDDKLLCFVDTGRFWFYPPSPWVLRIADDDPDQERLMQLLEAALPVLREGHCDNTVSGETVLRQSVNGQWFAIGLLALVLLVGYLPIMLIFGWPLTLLLTAIIGVPILIGLVLHKSRH